jgi:hypothetical protein
VALGRRGGSRETWWLLGGVVALKRRGGSWETWWLNGSVPDCCPAVPYSNPASPQPTADCQSPGGTWLLADLCERQQRRKLQKNKLLVRQKHIKKKNKKEVGRVSAFSVV